MQKVGKALILLIFVFILTSLFTGAVSAVDGDVIYVSTSGDDSNTGFDPLKPKLTIGSATENLNENGQINIADGTYTGEGNTGLTIPRSMTLKGQSETGTIINGDDGTSKRQIFYIPSGVTVNLQDLTLTNGNGDYGGGAINNDGNLNVNHCTFTNNYAIHYGGAIQNYGTLTANGCTFTGNNANMGGAISNFRSISLNVNNCVFTGNGHPEAIYLNGGPFEIIGNHFLNNGMGIYIIYTSQNMASTISSYLINFNRFYGNTEYGIFLENSAPTANDIQPITLDARYNWWGSNAGPNGVGADKTNLDPSSYTPWMVMSFSPTQAVISGGSTTPIVANFLYDSWGVYHDPANGHIPDGTPVLFTTSLGQVGSQQTIKYTINAMASALLRAWDEWGRPVSGLAILTARTDGQILSSSATITTNAASKTIGMQHTGLPTNYLIIAILMVISGLIIPKRK